MTMPFVCVCVCALWPSHCQWYLHGYCCRVFLSDLVVRFCTPCTVTRWTWHSSDLYNCTVFVGWLSLLCLISAVNITTYGPLCTKNTAVSMLCIFCSLIYNFSVFWRVLRLWFWDGNPYYTPSLKSTRVFKPQSKQYSLCLEKENNLWSYVLVMKVSFYCLCLLRQLMMF